MLQLRFGWRFPKILHGEVHPITSFIIKNDQVVYPIERFFCNLLFRFSRNKVRRVGGNEDVLVNVPPGQSRDFDSSIYGNRISAKGTRSWNYSINSITANVP